MSANKDLKEGNLIYDNQHGFMKNKGALTTDYNFDLLL